MQMKQDHVLHASFCPVNFLLLRLSLTGTFDVENFFQRNAKNKGMDMVVDPVLHPITSHNTLNKPKGPLPVSASALDAIVLEAKIFLFFMTRVRFKNKNLRV